MALYSYRRNDAEEYNTWIAFYKDNKEVAIAKVFKSDDGYIASFGGMQSYGKSRDLAVEGIVRRRFHM